MTTNQGATTIDRLIAIGLALLAASAAAAEPNPTDNPSSFTPQRDAAVVYVKERSFYISRMAQRCRKILDMPESPDSQPEATAWNAANRRYSTAVAIYESKQQPADPIQAFQSSLALGKERLKSAYAKADRELDSSDDRTLRCNRFFADSQAGKLDITPQDEHYEVLEGIAREFVRR
ncbi:MAG: hypothetical protein EPO12_19820 [Aquabacterium sp.]|jgi:hypothetical protein|nr:MAG: hypothetical protein EPO12_19820 [Aquabacterium sp.]